MLNEFLGFCTQCGLCTAVCTPARFSTLNPRLFVQAVLTRDIAHIEHFSREAIWACTQCGECDRICPEGIQPSRLIANLRAQTRYVIDSDEGERGSRSWRESVKESKP